MIRKDMNDLVYRTQKGKFSQVIEEIERRHKTGQPILVGTVSVEVSEMLSKMLRMRGIEHVVLNAKYHAREAEIVAQAGHYGAVTIATNMAGRGTDILLGGNPEFLARRAMKQKGYEDNVIDEATGFNENVSEEVLAARVIYKQLYADFKKQTDAEHDRVIAVGGLHIIGTERHESRRIDNQLRGRAGRQGDPGSSQFFLSMQDDLMRLFGSERVSGLIEKMGLAEDEPIEAKMLTGQIENAQKRIEARNYEIRKNVLQYDDVMNEQRKEIYEQRKQVLEGRDMHETIVKMADKLIEEAVATYCGNGDEYADWDMEGLTQYLERLCIRIGFFKAHEEAFKTVDKEELIAKLKQEARDFYAPAREGLRADPHRPARAGARRAALLRGSPLDGSHRRDGSAPRRHRPARLRQQEPHHRIPDRGLRHVRRDGALHPRRHRPPHVSGAHQHSAAAQGSRRAEGNQPRTGQGGGRPFRPEARAEAGRPKRSLPLRKRQEV